MVVECRGNIDGDGAMALGGGLCLGVGLVGCRAGAFARPPSLVAARREEGVIVGVLLPSYWSRCSPHITILQGCVTTQLRGKPERERWSVGGRDAGRCHRHILWGAGFGKE